MSSLNGNIGDGLDRIVKAKAEFMFGFKLPSPLLLVDADRLVTVGNENGIVTDTMLVTDDGTMYRYFDLAKVWGGDYRRILNAISDGADGIIFWNADGVSAVGGEKEDIENVVRFALKGDTIPNGWRNDEPIDFSTMKVAVQCETIPEYLNGCLEGAYIIDTKTIQ